MRILVVGLNYAPEHAGIAPYTTGTARALAAAGHDVRVVAGFPYYPQWRTAAGYRGLVRHETDGPVRLTRLRHFVPRDSAGLGRILHEGSFAAHAWLRARGLRDVDVVLGISPSLLSLVAARQLAATAGAAFGVVVQDLYASAAAELGTPGGSHVGRLEGRLLRAADGVVAVHECFAEALRQRHGVEPGRITVIRNWTHTGPPADEPWPEEHPWPAGRGPVVLHAGNMGAKQGLENVVAAARLAEERGEDVRFMLVGDGSRRAELCRLATGIRRASVLPPVPDRHFPGMLAAADVLVVNERPGLRSVCVPSKLTSYFAAGRPVLAATEPDSPAGIELAAAGAGVRVTPGDPEALLAAALQLGHDRERADRFGESGRRYAKTVLGADEAARRYRDWVTALGERSPG
ncbi:glycosyltransferase WbuB [Amycolatopsis sp. NBRC 101858]|uniref:glycosyltransferase family 4 protein n=1 Tax=Amycolatopsis sp. NBRC 101858 TaxID=3032200 RepID=UPI0024A3E05A|nr:glycosyltransferase family 4 protein [Amycolatopsis sp. NBRC 101858]GLY39027.1 glycosyltransferase WbuB [Amycolatopsis sp. NBRC 101858]